ncbi:alpha/beta hydrolase family protein [Pseudomonas sp. DSP3-2-2]|uniref:alpha/beta hydrolase family protein n=1 Tax=unclassified Pseudomonas TaxID=196821 RepID=UPI003CE7F7DA
MSYTFRAMLPALWLALILPCAPSASAADPEPAKDAGAEPVIERAPLLPRSEEDALALEGRVPQADQQQLQAGDETFLALWKPANSDEPKGAVIIVPGADESADWPDAVGPLRRRFPDIGWASLSLTLPDVKSDFSQPREVEAAPVEGADKPKEAPKDAAPKDAAALEADKAAAAEKEAAATAASAAAAEEQAKANAEQIFARIESAISFAQQHKARSIVLLGHGSGAYWAARFLSERPSPLIQKFVMVTAQEPLDAKPPLLELVPTLKMKTSDFVYKEQVQAREAATARLQVSKRTKNAGFTQVALTAIPGNEDAEQEQMFRRVRGWIEAK